MSEIREEIFKENQINKNSPCPNTPSPLCEGLEGKGNLIKNKFYSAIGINKSLFNKNNTLKKKAPTLQPTTRDLFLLEKLESYGVLSTQQIRELVFNGINTRTVLRRLRLLKQRGFIFSSEGLPKGGLAWILSKKSANFFKQDLSHKIINKNTLQHDVAVSSIRIHLERLKIVKSWTAEHILKKEIIRSPYRERKESSYFDEGCSLVPDSLFITKHEGEMKAVALELELSLKSRARYKKIFFQYEKKREIWFVWYVVLTRSMGKLLSDIWGQCTLWKRRQFAYSTLEEVF